MEQDLLTLSEHLNSQPFFSEVRVTRSLVLCACFVDRCFPFCPFSVGHCDVCPLSIYEFSLRICYLQTLLTVLYICSFVFLYYIQISMH